MKQKFIILLALIAFSNVSAQNKIHEDIINNKEVLIVSEFSNLNLKIKKGDKDLVSPDYSKSYILFKDDYIGFHILNSNFFSEPILLSKAKIVRNSEDNILIFTYEGDMINVSKLEDKLTWTKKTDKIEFKWEFENLKLNSGEKLNQYLKTYGFIGTEELSQNSQNLIGLPQHEIIRRFSEYYKKPSVFNQHIEGISEEGDEILYFEYKEDAQIFTVFVFDTADICKYILYYYPTDFYQSISANYTDIYGPATTDLTWFEKIEKTSYSYQIQFLDDQFVIHMSKF